MVSLFDAASSLLRLLAPTTCLIHVLFVGWRSRLVRWVAADPNHDASAGATFAMHIDKTGARVA